MPVETISEGLALYNAIPFSVVPAEVRIPVPKEGKGWAHISVVISANAADTTTVAIHGKLNAGDTYRALKQADNTTALSIAQAAGAAVNVASTVQLMPYMKVVLSGTSTANSLAKVWIEAAGAASRTNS